MMDGIRNFLQFVNDNWTSIVIILGLCVALYEKIKAFLSKSNAEKIESAKAQLKEVMLKLITDAEVDYESWNKAGSIKRSQVIQKIFSDYPVLSRVTDQQEIINWIDTSINDALKTLRKIVAEQPVAETDKGGDENE